jgi:ABC-type antimicrobial peptide transport system permease subunit
VLWTILRQGLTLVSLGLAIGLLGSLALSHFMSSLLFEVTPTDFATFFAVSTILMTIGVAACVVPARRATIIDPLVALRSEP